MKTPRAGKAQGFTLVEVTIVLAIMLVLAVLLMAGIRYATQTRARENYVAIQAREMALLRSAMKQYAVSHDASFASGVAVTIPVTTLITAALLPEDFAKRNGAVGTTPMFQTYQAIGRKDAVTGKIAIVIAELGGPLASRLQQMGIAANDSMVLAFKQQVAEEANKAFKIVAGTVDKKSTIANGVFGAFTKDIVAFLGTANTLGASAVVLQGFSDLEPDDISTTPGSKWKSCWFYQTEKRFGTWILPSCPAGTTQLAKTAYCNYAATSMLYPSDVGTLYLSRRMERTSDTLITNWSCNPITNPSTCTSPQPVTARFDGYRVYYDVQLNGAIVATDAGTTQVCEEHRYDQGFSNTPNGTCYAGYPTSNVYPCIKNYPDTFTASEARTALGVNPYDLLCCSPN